MAEEARAVQAVLAKVRAGKALWVSSSVLEAELVRIPDPDKRSYLLEMLSFAGERVEATMQMSARATQLKQFGLGAYDALHLACAEAAKCDVLLTTDDRFLKRSERLLSRVQLHNPIDWLRGTHDE